MKVVPFVLLAACAGEHTFLPPDTTDTGDTAVVETDDTVDTDTQDTDTGTDVDQDGWTVEEGDCDDGDIWVNPGWYERKDDGKDNNCNGLVDEKFAGLTFVESGDGTVIHDLDLLGDVTHSVTVQAGLTPGGVPAATQIGPRVSGEGWAFTDGAGQVGEIDDQGAVTVLWDDSKTEYADGTEPVGYFGVARHPDGYYLVSGGDRLWRVDPDGTVTTVAEWDCLEGTEGVTDICPLDVAVNPFTGVVSLFGIFGGYAEWTEGGGLDLVIADNPDPYAPKYQFWSALVLDNGTALALGADPDGNQGVFAWDADAQAYDPWYTFPEAVIADSYQPVDFGVDQISGDLYVTTNRDWFPYVWRIAPDVPQADVLYPDQAIYDPWSPDYDPPPSDHDAGAILVRYSTAP